MDGKVTVCCVGAAERLVKPDLPEGLTEVFDIMRLFQPVNRVKGKAKFSVIERCQFFADGMGFHGVIACAVIVPGEFAVTFKGVAIGDIEAFTVEKDAQAECRRENNVIEGLQGEIKLIFYYESINPIICEINGFRIAVAVKRGFAVALEERTLSIFIVTA